MADGTPVERYRTIVVDPPWEISDFPAKLHGDGAHLRTPRQTIQPDGRNVDCPYTTMSIEEIMALPVGDLAAVEAHLYLWTIPAFLEASYGVARSWGFEPMYPLAWCKAPKGRGLGGKFASNIEFVLFCRERHGAVRITSYLADAAKAAGITARDVNRAMGTSDMAGWWLSRLPHRARIPTVEQWAELKTLLGCDDRFDEDVRLVNDHRHDEQRSDTRWFNWPRGAHSEKPEAFLDLVESVSPGPYVELFARRARFGWDYYGDESLGTVTMEAHA